MLLAFHMSRSSIKGGSPLFKGEPLACQSQRITES